MPRKHSAAKQQIEPELRDEEAQRFEHKLRAGNKLRDELSTSASSGEDNSFADSQVMPEVRLSYAQAAG